MLRPVNRVMVVMVIRVRVVTVERAVAEYRIVPRIPPDGSEIRVVTPAPPRIPVIVESPVPAVVAVKVAPSPAYSEVGPVRIVVISPIVIRSIVKIELVKRSIVIDEIVRYSYQSSVFNEFELCGFSCRNGQSVGAVSCPYEIYVGGCCLLCQFGKAFVVRVPHRGFITVIETVLVPCSRID